MQTTDPHDRCPWCGTHYLECAQLFPEKCCDDCDPHPERLSRTCDACAEFRDDCIIEPVTDAYLCADCVKDSYPVSNGRTMTPDVLKVAVCDAMIAINDEVDPVTRQKWGPIIPPTAIDWIGDAIVAAILAADDRYASVTEEPDGP